MTVATSGTSCDLSPDQQALKVAAKKLIRAAGGIEAAAMHARPHKTAMGDYGSPNCDRYMPIDTVADLEAITRGSAEWPIVTRALAARAGCSLVVLPEPVVEDSNWFSEISELVQHHSALAASLCDAAADQKVTAREVQDKKLIALCDEAICDLVNLRARLEGIVGAFQ